MRIVYFLIATFLSGLSAAHAQSVGPTTLNGAGGSATVGGNTYEWSVGEMTVVNTSTASNIVVTQGVLQPSQNASGISTEKTSATRLKVYPVPTLDIVYMQPSFNKPGKLTYLLTDAAGKTVQQQQVSLQTGQELQSVNMGSLPSGNYMLRVQFANADAPYSSVFKIQKIQ